MSTPTWFVTSLCACAGSPLQGPEISGKAVFVYDGPRMSNESRESPSLRASIIIATHNRRDLLEACLRSLPWDEIAQAPGEVIVMDDASTDDTGEMVRTHFPQAVYRRNAANLGLAQTHNLAATHARGSLLLNLDSDVEVAPGWFRAMLAADDGRSVLGGRVLDHATGKPQSGPRRSTFLGKSLPCSSSRASVGIGCNLAFPASIFEDLQGFDPDLPCYFEDSDFCIRARRRGHGFKYVPAAVYHKGSPIRLGEAVYLQERHSTYAMLKAYRGKPLHVLAFSAGNGLWLLLRLVAWGLRGRGQDCKRLARGWLAAYRRYWYNAPHY